MTLILHPTWATIPRQRSSGQQMGEASLCISSSVCTGRLGDTVLNVAERFDPGIERWEMLPRRQGGRGVVVTSLWTVPIGSELSATVLRCILSVLDTPPLSLLYVWTRLCWVPSHPARHNSLQDQGSIIYNSGAWPGQG